MITIKTRYTMIQCAIIDDEPLAREGMARYVREVDFLQLAGTCEDPLQLMKMMDAAPIDLVFLDIQTPKMNGIEFLKIVQRPPMVIITTAFPGYALDGFQLNALDYLLKPITFDRFLKAANKARDYHRLLAGNAEGGAGSDYFFIKCGSKYEKIWFDDILYVQGTQNYVTIYTQKGKYLALLYLKNVDEQLDSRRFIRVHKSYVVSIGKIDSIEGNEIIMGAHRIPISRNLREEVIQRVVADRLWDTKKNP